MTLDELISGAREDAPSKPRIHPLGQIARMRELAPRFTEPCPFKVGDLVTPRKDGFVRGSGQPCLVLHIHAGDKSPDFRIGESGSPDFGVIPDIRVARVTPNGTCVAFWTYSSEMVPYTGEGSGA